jgi:hypothetical protein
MRFTTDSSISSVVAGDLRAILLGAGLATITSVPVLLAGSGSWVLTTIGSGAAIVCWVVSAVVALCVRTVAVYQTVYFALSGSASGLLVYSVASSQPGWHLASVTLSLAFGVTSSAVLLSMLGRMSQPRTVLKRRMACPYCGSDSSHALVRCPECGQGWRLTLLRAEGSGAAETAPNASRAPGPSPPPSEPEDQSCMNQ